MIQVVSPPSCQIFARLVTYLLLGELSHSLQFFPIIGLGTLGPLSDLLDSAQLADLFACNISDALLLEHVPITALAQGLAICRAHPLPYFLNFELFYWGSWIWDFFNVVNTTLVQLDAELRVFDQLIVPVHCSKGRGAAGKTPRLWIEWTRK
jgi:hypothetical protein